MIKTTSYQPKELFVAELEFSFTKVQMAVDEKGSLCWFELDDEVSRQQIVKKWKINTLLELSASKKQLWIDRVNSFMAGKSLTFNINLQGSAFQKQVWQHLLKLKRGQLLTYSELAVAVGRPKAVRAAASAVANSYVALFIPCHRVIHKNASSSLRYRWGPALKNYLINNEQNKKN